jgi:hypothetical protein
VRRVELSADTLQAQLAAEVARITLDDALRGYGDPVRARQQEETAGTFTRLVRRDVQQAGLEVGADAVSRQHLGTVRVIA